MGLLGIFALMVIVCHVVILIHAFKTSTGQGFMCLCIPWYIFYYMFTTFEHPRKGLVIGGYLGGCIMAYALFAVGQSARSRAERM